MSALYYCTALAGKLYKSQAAVRLPFYIVKKNIAALLTVACDSQLPG